MNIFEFIKKYFMFIFFMVYRFFNIKYPIKKKFIIFGLPSSGKTSIIYFFKLGYLITNVKTYFINEEKFTLKIKNDKNHNEEKNYEINFYEIGHNCSYNLVKEYADISDDIIYIIDSIRKDKLCECREDFIRIIYDFRFIYRKCKFLIFMNKQDSNGCLKPEEIINYFALPNELQYRCKFISSSTLSGQGLNEGLEWLLNYNVFSEKEEIIEQRKKLYDY
ncbi:ADP-ribosylation factor, putative [Plasmodium berghei]|uniref:ADP-ribosylation factor, putative n=2 Tax=Plasmodium berghei TaxID=5821 RepID=A0A509ARH0_PLABA|nr:ADP-ribosylation factor, putative [Plasmodium berghei ANKA]CXJ14217.1 ADP-ribosylation factor, putative [Plasmodium berghei]SCM26176.1 ADP-ribosylation factor, putative [Plasmodium berghei]SCN28317.1 ADP-ribosylation factor, putative [Plasmodium berghei]SCO62515.1 ADP-ribosylation factor, putative [Plasmodium berghei]SCO64073.1 ADP-ribosylation factor, putative [Plasmodium berghei]|eukprot:XP_034423969.1 ADP-ribosylation factor, putative [Plasmodium berghei ANKA]